MNESKTPKIVVGVALAALYATGFAYVAVRGTHDSVAAPNAPIAAEPAVSPAIIPASTDALVSASEQSVPPVAAAAPVATVSRTEEVDFEESSGAKEEANARNEPANSSGDTHSVQEGSESSASESQTTSDAQSQVSSGPARSSEISE
jgi:hypothetical protein